MIHAGRVPCGAACVCVMQVGVLAMEGVLDLAGVVICLNGAFECGSGNTLAC